MKLISLLNKNNKKPKITDWIQAIAAAISIPAAIVALFAFFQKDKELQQQINNLDIVAKQSIEQTDILKDELDFLRKQQEITESNRNSDILPIFSIEFKRIHGTTIQAEMINDGETAEILEIKELESNDYKIVKQFDYIGANKRRKIYFHLKNGNDISNSILAFKIKYKDIDGNIHIKRFHFENIYKKIEERNRRIIPTN